MKTITLVLLLVLSVSCSDSANEITSKNRLEFISGKTETQMKAAFSDLSFLEQRELWLDKFDQTLKTNIPKEYRVIIKEFTFELEKISTLKEFFENEEIKSLSIKIASSISQDDYIAIFMKLEDFKYFESTSKSKAVCSICVNSLLDDWANQAEKYNASGRQYQMLPKCDCDWTCPDGSDGIECTTTSCESTARGCGFLWLFSCTEKRVFCDAV